MPTNSFAARRAGMLALSLVLFAPAAGAQQWTASAVASASDARPIESMRGAQLQFTATLERGVSGLRLGVLVLRRGIDGTGVPCAGLVEPGTCAPEPIREEAALNMGTAGLEFDVVRRTTTRLSVHIDGGVGRISTETTGRTSSRRISASASALGAFGGADLTWWPRGGLIGVTTGAALGWGHQFGVGSCVDCYNPFAGGFSLNRVHAGLSLRHGR